MTKNPNLFEMVYVYVKFKLPQILILPIKKELQFMIAFDKYIMPML